MTAAVQGSYEWARRLHDVLWFADDDAARSDLLADLLAAAADATGAPEEFSGLVALLADVPTSRAVPLSVAEDWPRRVATVAARLRGLPAGSVLQPLHPKARMGAVVVPHAGAERLAPVPLLLEVGAYEASGLLSPLGGKVVFVVPDWWMPTGSDRDAFEAAWAAACTLAGRRTLDLFAMVSPLRFSKPDETEPAVRWTGRNTEKPSLALPLAMGAYAAVTGRAERLRPREWLATGGVAADGTVTDVGDLDVKPHVLQGEAKGARLVVPNTVDGSDVVRAVPNLRQALAETGLVVPGDGAVPPGEAGASRRDRGPFDAPLVVLPRGGGGPSSIAAAVAEAVPGQPVHVRPGVYRESIVLDRTLALVADGGPGEVVIQPQEGLPCLRIQGGQAEVRGVTFASSVSPAVVVAAGRLVLEKCDLSTSGTGTDEKGEPRPVACVGVESGADVILRGCGLHDSASSGAWIGPGGRAVLEDCDIHDNTVGVWAEAGAVLTLRRCRIGSNRRFGVATDETRGVVEDCEFRSNGTIAMVAWKGRFPSVRRCRIEGSVNGVQLTEGVSGSLEDLKLSGNRCGIIVGGASEAAIRRCAIADSAENGINIQGGAVVLEDCEVAGTLAHAGVFVAGGSPTLRRCRVHNGKNAGLWVDPDAEATVEQCEFAENGGQALEVRSKKGVTLTASTVRGNSWGISVREGAKLRAESTSCTGNKLWGAWLGGDVRLRGCTFSENPGGGVSIEASSSVVIEDCSLDDRETPLRVERGTRHRPVIVGGSIRRSLAGELALATLAAAFVGAVAFFAVALTTVGLEALLGGPKHRVWFCGHSAAYAAAAVSILFWDDSITVLAARTLGAAVAGAVFAHLGFLLLPAGVAMEQAVGAMEEIDDLGVLLVPSGVAVSTAITAAALAAAVSTSIPAASPFSVRAALAKRRWAGVAAVVAGAFAAACFSGAAPRHEEAAIPIACAVLGISVPFVLHCLIIDGWLGVRRSAPKT